MGGRDHEFWDGMPMSFLIREIMEKAATVDEAMAIMRKTPRTCEYYYVISDAHKNMLAMRARPELLDVFTPGQQHELLPKMPPETVLISLDERAKKLSERLHANYGKITPEMMIEIIKRPVSMESNLHNAVFMPETLDMWFADAGKTTPACDEPYTKVNLRVLLEYYRAEMGEK
jgi:hypothetical protein